MATKRILDKGRILNSLFYVGFFMISFSMMLDRSALVERQALLFDTFELIGTSLFVVKFAFSKHEIKEFIISSLCMMMLLAFVVFCGYSATILTTCCAIVSVKNVNIRTVLKMDLMIKSFFIIIHSLIFMVDYLSGFELALSSVSEAVKGTAISLYFVNPNTTGLIGTWIAIEMLFLKREKKFQDYVVPTMIAVTTFLITISRTPFFVYIVYLLLQFVKNEKILTITQKVLYPILCLVTFAMISFLSPGMPVFDIVDPLLSGRLGLSVAVYNISGISIFPSSWAIAILSKYLIDIFYVKCLLSYGLITMIIAYVPHALMPSSSSMEEKRISIITSLYLLFETVLVNIGFAPAYLIIADSIYNSKRKDNV